MSQQDVPTPREEDIIEAIYRNPRRDAGVSVSELCRALGLAKPTVSIMLKKLQEKGLVQRQPYRKVFLTEEGEKKAKAVLQLHEAIKSVLIKSGTPEDIAEQDACHMEHFLHPQTLQALIDSVFYPMEKETRSKTKPISDKGS
jgi:Mn-dependent DtxR family transcriptional regulator